MNAEADAEARAPPIRVQVDLPRRASRSCEGSCRCIASYMRKAGRTGAAAAREPQSSPPAKERLTAAMALASLHQGHVHVFSRARCALKPTWSSAIESRGGLTEHARCRQVMASELPDHVPLALRKLDSLPPTG